MIYDDTAASLACARLRDALGVLLTKPGDYDTGIAGLTLYRREEESEPGGQGCAIPHATVVFQGAERVLVNGREFTCRQCECRVNHEDAYGTGHIADASTEKPFLAASLELDRKLLRELRAGPAFRVCDDDMAEGITVTPADAKVLDAFHRLVELCRTPSRIPFLAPLIIYEIHYLLVAGITGSHFPQ